MIGERYQDATQDEDLTDEGLPVASDITRSIIWMAHLIERYANARLPTFDLPPDLTMPRARLLLAVAAGAAEQTSTRMSDIAFDLGVTARTITTMVDALEQDGLVERVPDKQDRRAISLVLTEEGQQRVPHILHAIEEISQAVVAPLSPSDREALRDLLVRLIERDAD